MDTEQESSIAVQGDVIAVDNCSHPALQAWIEFGEGHRYQCMVCKKGIIIPYTMLTRLSRRDLRQGMDQIFLEKFGPAWANALQGIVE